MEEDVRPLMRNYLKNIYDNFLLGKSHNLVMFWIGMYYIVNRRTFCIVQRLMPMKVFFFPYILLNFVILSKRKHVKAFRYLGV